MKNKRNLGIHNPIVYKIRTIPIPNVQLVSLLSIVLNVEFPEFLGNTAVLERNLLGKGHAWTGRCPVSLERTLKNFG
ncbi:MAG: hypothetical protein JSW15_08120 [Deltaproteobacteria bacterium]|jgi:hypothetical protein|nr:MAG: hypothetical protein JSW15_08120 [Deltaproteobacteria bacterium]